MERARGRAPVQEPGPEVVAEGLEQARAPARDPGQDRPADHWVLERARGPERWGRVLVRVPARASDRGWRRDPWVHAQSDPVGLPVRWPADSWDHCWGPKVGKEAGWDARLSGGLLSGGALPEDAPPVAPPASSQAGVWASVSAWGARAS